MTTHCDTCGRFTDGETCTSCTAGPARLVDCCPECKSTRFERRARLGGYRCDACSHVFETPAERRAKQHQPNNVGGLSAAGKAALEWGSD